MTRTRPMTAEERFIEDPRHQFEDSDEQFERGLAKAQAEDAGAAAFKAYKGNDRDRPRSPYEDTVLVRAWQLGWDSALSAKVQAFEKYRNTRSLFARQYAPPHLQHCLPKFQEVRQKSIAFLETEYPDFKAAYEELTRG